MFVKIRFLKPSVSVKKIDKIYIFPESGSGKHFQASGMRAIDFLHDFTPIEAVLANFFSDISPLFLSPL